MRKYYLDNIRWATVLLVLVYHVFYIYNALGIPGGIGGFYRNQPWDVFATFVYPWFMVLLFVIAGMSARYALERQTDREFMKSKVTKLLVPSTLGLFAWHAVAGYLNIKISGALDTIPKAILYPICAISGIGPLWFIQTLFLFSWFLTLIRKIKGSEKLYGLGEKSNLVILLLFALPVWGTSHILNTPVITVYRFGIYFFTYLLGYFVFSHDTVQDTLMKYRFLLLGAAAVCAGVYLFRFYGTNYTEDGCLRHPLTNLYLWMTVLAGLGCGKAWFDKTGTLAAYLTKSSFGIYVVHYLICAGACVLLKRTPLPVFVIYCLAILLTLGLSPLVYEGLRRVPFIRYITFGIRKKD